MNTWHKCLGCGGYIGLMVDGLPPWEEPGAVMHTKPLEDANKRPVQCSLYRNNSAQYLTKLHKDTPTVPPPGNIAPIPFGNPGEC